MSENSFTNSQYFNNTNNLTNKTNTVLNIGDNFSSLNETKSKKSESGQINNDEDKEKIKFNKYKDLKYADYINNVTIYESQVLNDKTNLSSSNITYKTKKENSYLVEEEKKIDKFLDSVKDYMPYLLLSVIGTSILGGYVYNKIKNK